jgi:hypothetical protein
MMAAGSMDVKEDSSGRSVLGFLDIATTDSYKREVLFARQKTIVM